MKNLEIKIYKKERGEMKYARCADCDKKLFKITPDMNL